MTRTNIHSCEGHYPVCILRHVHGGQQRWWPCSSEKGLFSRWCSPVLVFSLFQVPFYPYSCTNGICHQAIVFSVLKLAIDDCSCHVSLQTLPHPLHSIISITKPRAVNHKTGQLLGKIFWIDLFNVSGAYKYTRLLFLSNSYCIIENITIFFYNNLSFKWVSAWGSFKGRISPLCIRLSHSSR